jgi:outer membrane biosynthesis protein TonB
VPVYDRKIKLTKKPQPVYTKRARRNRISGSIKVVAEFLGDGKIGFVFPLETLPDGLTESAVNAAKATEFDPAVKDGKPVAVLMVLEYSFLTY